MSSVFNLRSDQRQFSKRKMSKSQSRSTIYYCFVIVFISTYFTTSVTFIQRNYNATDSIFPFFFVVNYPQELHTFDFVRFQPVRVLAEECFTVKALNFDKWRSTKWVLNIFGNMNVHLTPRNGDAEDWKSIKIVLKRNKKIMKKKFEKPHDVNYHIPHWFTVAVHVSGNYKAF